MCLDLIETCRSQLNDRNNGIFPEETVREIIAYWNKNKIDIICDLYSSSPDSPLLLSFGDKLKPNVSEYLELAKKIEKRDELYAEYNRLYYELG